MPQNEKVERISCTRVNMCVNFRNNQEAIHGQLPYAEGNAKCTKKGSCKTGIVFKSLKYIPQKLQ